MVRDEWAGGKEGGGETACYGTADAGSRSDVQRTLDLMLKELQRISGKPGLTLNPANLGGQGFGGGGAS